MHCVLVDGCKDSSEIDLALHNSNKYYTITMQEIGADAEIALFSVAYFSNMLELRL